MQTPKEQQDNQHLNTLLKKLRPFQRKAFDFAVNGIHNSDDDHNKQQNPQTKPSGHRSASVAGAGTGRILCADEMGLGKTITSLAIMSAYQQSEWPLLILCPASLRYTWPSEIEKFLPWISSQSTYVVRGADDVSFAQQIVNWRRKKAEQNKPTFKPAPYQIVICTYSLLQNRFAVSKALQNCNFECVIADESHNLKQKDSQRCQLALPILKQSKRLVLLSGTPALNRPVELYAQLTALDPTGRIFPGSGNMSYSQYTKRYCNGHQSRFGYNVTGISNADELHQCLKKVMLRRLKSQVLQDLPSKQRSIVPIKMKDKDKQQESQYIMEDWSAASKALDRISDLDADDVAQAAKNESRRAMMQAYQASGIAKASAIAEYIIDWLRGCDSSQKLVVFAHHKDVMDCLQEAITKDFKGKLGMIRIDGSVSPLERAASVKKFQTNRGVRLALLSMTAAGVGLTLTAASNIIFAELHWTPGVLAQAEDRCHRIGQANSVNVTYCICKDEDLSIDMVIWKMLTNKTGNLSKIVDGERKGLDAVETSIASNGNRCSSSSGVSAEEDLVNFFASSTTTQTTKAKSGPPVKGTIQSFFKKQASAKGSSKAPTSVAKKKVKSLDGKTSPNSVACISLLDCDEVNSFVNCPACTFENHAGAMFCTMCQSPIDSVSSKPKGHDQLHQQQWSCSACTFTNSNEALACEVCGAEKNENSSEKVQEIRSVHLPDQLSPLSGESKLDKSGASFDKTRKRANSQLKDHREFYIENVDTEGIQPLQLPDQLSSSSDDDSDESVTSYHVDQKNCSKTREAAVPNLSQNSTAAASECIDLTQEDEYEEKKPSHTKKSRHDYEHGTFRFSVSKNSGRIALHSHSSGEPLHVNFDIGQIVTPQCSNQLQESTLSRKSPKKQCVLQFDDGRIRRVLSELNDCSLLPKSRKTNLQSTMINEIKLYVTCYMNLREIEKKAVKESNEAIAASSLTQTAARLLQSTVCGSTDRYSNGGQALGAKERAIENQKNNVATASDKLVLQKLACAWCAAPFQTENLTVDVDATYCSWECAEEGRVRRGNMFSSTQIRSSLFALERYVTILLHYRFILR